MNLVFPVTFAPSTLVMERRRRMSQRLRVLIADDEPRARRSLRALLSTWPEVQVMGEAADGQEVVRLAEECQPDVVLLDIRMPVPTLPALNGRPGSGADGMDSLEVIRIIKSRWPDTHIVVLTMYADHRADALAAGADDFVLKGNTEALLEAIRQALPHQPTEQYYP